MINKKIIAFLLTLSIVGANFIGSASQVDAYELNFSQTEITEVTDLINNLLSYENDIMKIGKSNDYSDIINDDKLLEMIETKQKYKEEWYKDINFNISDYSSKVKINKETKLTDNKYILDITYSSKLVLNDDSDIHPSMSDDYIFEIENKLGKWVINKMVSKNDYEDISNENESANKQLVKGENNDGFLEQEILDNNNEILDTQITELEEKINTIDESVNDYKEMMNKINDNLENGSEKATPSYSGINRAAVAKYARRWANNANSDYKEYNGKDCTNFASQSIYAGGVPTNSYWAPYTTSWINVPEFYNYMSSNGYLSGDTDLSNANLGDVIQWKHSYKNNYSHSTVVTGFNSSGVVLSAHSNNRRDYPIANYWSDFSSARNMHFW